MDSTKLQKISDSLLNMLLIEKTNSVALKKILILALIFLCAFQIGNLQADQETLKKSESPIEKRIENFFNSLKDGQTDLAFSKLLENSPIAKDGANITKLVKETNQTLKKYGKPLNKYFLESSTTQKKYLGASRFFFRVVGTFF